MSLVTLFIIFILKLYSYKFSLFDFSALEKWLNLALALSGSYFRVMKANGNVLV